MSARNEQILAWKEGAIGSFHLKGWPNIGKAGGLTFIAVPLKQKE